MKQMSSENDAISKAPSVLLGARWMQFRSCPQRLWMARLLRLPEGNQVKVSRVTSERKAGYIQEYGKIGTKQNRLGQICDVYQLLTGWSN